MAKANQEVKAASPNFPVGMEEFVGAGMEDMGVDDCAIPFIKIVQKGSPIMDTEAGARPGMFLNSVSNELYSELILIPCGFKKEIVQWADRDSGGGIKGTHPWDTPLMAETVPNEKGVPTFPAEHEFATDILVETRYHYVYCISPDTGEAFPALISMSSTQHKRSRKWAAMMKTKKILIDGQRVTPPSFAFKYVAQTEMEAKDKNTWYSWVITGGEQVEEDWLMRECVEFYKSIKSDAVKVSAEDVDA